MQNTNKNERVNVCTNVNSARQRVHSMVKVLSGMAGGLACFKLIAALLASTT